MVEVVSAERVPVGVYRNAACELTEQHGELDKYTLAKRVGVYLGRYVSSRPAGRWIRRQVHGNGGVLRRVGAARNGPIASGGCPATYAVVEVELRDWRKEQGTRAAA